MINILANVIAFFIYSYLCVTIEHINYYIHGETYYYKLTNPIITAFPLYGIGAYCFILINQFMNDIGIGDIHIIPQLVIKLLVLGIVASIIEYITGKYFANAGKTANVNCEITGWDYSTEPYNIDGIISLEHMFLWGILGLFIISIHPYLMKFITCGLACYNLD